MSISVRFYNRDFTMPILSPVARLSTEVVSYSWAAVGGPEQAKLSVYGNEEDLWETIEILRCPIEIVDDNNDDVWWGYVAEVQLTVGALVVGVTLDSMSNKVAVAYNSLTPGASDAGSRSTTDWSSDTDSVAEYGTKEALISVSEVTDSVATTVRDKVLAAAKYPVPTVATGKAAKLEATLVCRGFFDTLLWRFWSQAAGIEQHTDGAETQKIGLAHSSANISFDSATKYIADTGNNFGYFEAGDAIHVSGSTSNNGRFTIASVASNGAYVEVNETLVDESAGATVAIQLEGVKVWQSFQVGEAWDAYNIKLYMAAIGSPSDTVYAELWSYAAGVPDTQLSSGSLAASSISANEDWINFDLNTVVSLAVGTTYCIVVSRSGAETASYLTVGVDEGVGYASGIFKMYAATTTSWVFRVPDADMEFKIGGVQETTAQITAIESGVGEFITGVTIEDASGVKTSQYRNGDGTAYDEIVELLNIGTSNNRRLLAEVTKSRDLRVWEEPVSGAEDYYLSTDGTLADRWGAPVLPQRCPVGVWAKLKDVVPATADTSKIANPSPVFIERSEYNVRTGTLRLEPRGIASPWDVGQLV